MMDSVTGRRSTAASSSRRTLGILSLCGSILGVNPSAAGEASRGAPMSGLFAFEPNLGQADSATRFVGRIGGTVVHVENDALTLVRSDSTAATVQHRVRFTGADPAASVSGEELLPGVSHYLRGADPSRWLRDVPRFARVRVRDLYPGIDLVLHTAAGALEYDFEIQPYADPGSIAIRFDAPTALEGGGDLRVGSGPGALLQRRPIATQTWAGELRQVAAAYRREADAESERFTFDLGAYDPSRPLLIDPVLEISTYFGGGSNETARDLAIAADGGIVLVGETLSVDLPTTPGALDPTCGRTVSCATSADEDCFVAKLDAAGTAVVWLTYLGGDGPDSCRAVATDPSANVYVAGSASGDFPTTAGAFQTAPGCGTDGVVAKLNANGSTLLYSTYVGGPCGSDIYLWHTDFFWDLAVDASGRAFVVGTSNSVSYPTTAGSFDPVCGVQPFCDGFSPRFDAVVTALNGAGSGLSYSTFLGGSRDDFGTGIALGPTGEAFVTGVTQSYYLPSTPVPPGQTPFPTTAGAFQGAPTTNARRGFVTRLNAAGSALVYSTMLGGQSAGFSTEPEKIALAPGGYAVVVGSTMASDFPTLPPRTLTSSLMVSLGFVTKFAPTGASLVYSTLIGHEQESITGVQLCDVALDPLGKAYVVGSTAADSYPINDPLQPDLAGGRDAVLTVLQPNGAGQLSPVTSSFFHSTYFGGAGDDEAFAVALAGPGNAVFAGVTGSSDFPSANPIEPAPLGGTDAFVARVTDGTTNLIFADGFDWGDSSAWSVTVP